MQDFAELGLEMELFLEDGHQDIDRDRDPDLGLHGVWRSAVERLDAEVLFDPFEEQFQLPATLIELGDGQGSQEEVVGQKDQTLLGFGVEAADATLKQVQGRPERERIFLRGLGAGKRDGLIAPPATATSSLDSSPFGNKLTIPNIVQVLSRAREKYFYFFSGSKYLPKGQLGEGQREKLIAAGKSAH